MQIRLPASMIGRVLPVTQLNGNTLALSIWNCSNKVTRTFHVYTIPSWLKVEYRARSAELIPKLVFRQPIGYFESASQDFYENHRHRSGNGRHMGG